MAVEEGERNVRRGGFAGIDRGEAVGRGGGNALGAETALLLVDPDQRSGEAGEREFGLLRLLGGVGEGDGDRGAGREPVHHRLRTLAEEVEVIALAVGADLVWEREDLALAVHRDREVGPLVGAGGAHRGERDLPVGLLGVAADRQHVVAVGLAIGRLRHRVRRAIAARIAGGGPVLECAAPPSWASAAGASRQKQQGGEDAHEIRVLGGAAE